MLSSFLDSIKEQFGAKSYWLGSMLPLILFLTANTLVLYQHFPDIASWLSTVNGLEQKALLYSALTAALLALAFILSIMSSLMLEALEGKTGPFRWAAFLLCSGEWHALHTIDQKYQTALSHQREIENAQEIWSKRLERGKQIGKTQPALSRKDAAFWHFRAAGRKIATIRFMHRHGWCIKPRRLRRAAAWLKVALEQNNAGTQGVLWDAICDLKAAITYAIDRNQFEKRRLLHLRQTNFPGVRPTAPDKPEGPTANNILAPTAMGNIGRAMSTYPLRRYQMDLDIFWTRLQNTLQKSAKEYYSVLQDTKVQVDCAVTLFWLSLVFTLFWTPALVWWFRDSTVSEFLTVAIGGTVFVVGFYQLACQSYRVFADVMCSSVDLFRFQVLESLHIPPPLGSEEERDLWVRLGGAIGFGNLEDFIYRHKP